MSIEDIYIYLEPYDRNYSDKGFYIYPFRYSSYGDYLDVLNEDYLKPALPEVEEWEAVDSDGINSYMADAIGINEKNWDFLAELGELADDLGLDFYDMMEVSNHFGGADASYLEESYMGHHDSMLDYAYSIIDDQGEVYEDQAENYFDFEQFGRELKIDFVYSYYMDDWEDRFDSEEEAEQAYSDKMDERNEKVADWYIYDVVGDWQSAIGGYMTNPQMPMYFDYKKFARDLEYEYTEIAGAIWWAH